MVEMICSMAFALRFSRNPPTKNQAQATPLTTLVFSWGGEIKPNVTMTLANTTDAKITFNVSLLYSQ